MENQRNEFTQQIDTPSYQAPQRQFATYTYQQQQPIATTVVAQQYTKNIPPQKQPSISTEIKNKKKFLKINLLIYILVSEFTMMAPSVLKGYGLYKNKLFQKSFNFAVFFLVLKIMSATVSLFWVSTYPLKNQSPPTVSVGQPIYEDMIDYNEKQLGDTIPQMPAHPLTVKSDNADQMQVLEEEKKAQQISETENQQQQISETENYQQQILDMNSQQQQKIKEEMEKYAQQRNEMDMRTYQVQDPELQADSHIQQTTTAVKEMQNFFKPAYEYLIVNIIIFAVFLIIFLAIFRKQKKISTGQFLLVMLAFFIDVPISLIFTKTKTG